MLARPDAAGLALDSLLAFGREPIDQEREVQIAAPGPEFARIGFERRELVLVEEPGLVEQPADQRGLAVVDRAGGGEAQERRHG